MPSSGEIEFKIDLNILVLVSNKKECLGKRNNLSRNNFITDSIYIFFSDHKSFFKWKNYPLHFLFLSFSSTTQKLKPRILITALLGYLFSVTAMYIRNRNINVQTGFQKKDLLTGTKKKYLQGLSFILNSQVKYKFR